MEHVALLKRTWNLGQVSKLFKRFLKIIALAYIYSQTYSNDHLYKMTTRLRQPMPSPPKPIPIQTLLYKTTTCLTRPGNKFFVPQIKKQQQQKLPKTATAKLYPVEKWKAMDKKWTSLWFYLLHCYFIMQSLFNVFKNWTFTLNIRLNNDLNG